MKRSILSAMILSLALLSACGGGGGGDTSTPPAVNAAPVANAGADQSVLTNAVVTLDGSKSSDANNDPLTYAWTLSAKPVGSAAALTNPTSAKPTFIADSAGAYAATLIVNDGKVASAPDTVNVSVSVDNAAPVANAGPAQNVAVGSVVTLDGSASSDANGDALTYAWTLTTKPAGSAASLSSASSAKPTFTADLAGIYVASLVVNDGKVNSNSASISITATGASSACLAGNGIGTNGRRLYTPNNVFTFQLSTTVANAPDVATLGWGAAYMGPGGSYTGSLLATLWAVSSSYSGGTIDGNVLGNFPPKFSGTGAYSASQIATGGYSINTIVSSAVSYNPRPGNYCLVITLSEYMPGSCSPNPNGYCIVDWLQFGSPVTFY